MRNVGAIHLCQDRGNRTGSQFERKAERDETALSGVLAGDEDALPKSSAMRICAAVIFGANDWNQIALPILLNCMD